MPTIATFEGISIEMYYNDHAPPHFHALHGEHEALITIIGLEVLGGSLPPAILRRVRQWAGRKQAELALEWMKARNHLPLGKL